MAVHKLEINVAPLYLPIERITRTNYTGSGLGLGLGILASSYYLNNGETDQEDRGDGSTPVPLDLGELAASDNNLTRVKLQAEDSPSEAKTEETESEKTEEPFEIVEKSDVEEKTEESEEKPSEIDFSNFDNFECVSSTEVTSSSSLDATQKSSVDIPEDFDMFEGKIFLNRYFNLHSLKNLKCYNFHSTWNDFRVAFDPR